MNEINVKLTVDEANLILEGLGNLPFVRVYALIAKLQEQAGQQIDPAGPQNEFDQADSPDPKVKS